MILVSVLLPTRNRCETLRFALETLTSVDDDRFEIVVSDNASEDATREIVESNGDPRIRYVNPGERLGMSQNWEFALANSRGDWIGYVGDDDGLLPDALDTLRSIVAETRTEAVRARFCRYLWPSLLGQENGILRVPKSGGFTIVNSRQQLIGAMNGSVDYFGLPCLYNGGFAARTAIDRARAPSGRFINSRIPDIYSGVVLSHTLSSFVVAETPLAVHGASIYSTGTSQFTSSTSEKHKQPSAEFLREANLPFHPAVPLARDGTIPKSLTALIHESWYQAREIFPDIPGIEPQAQLEAVLRSAVHLDAVRQWAEDFAVLHHLPQPSNDASHAIRRVATRVFTLAAEGWNGGWHSDFAPEKSIANVAEAARLAAEVMHDPDEMSYLPLRNLWRVAKSLSGSSSRASNEPAGRPEAVA